MSRYIKHAPTLPLLTEENTAYWTGGKSGKLKIQYCQDCHHYTHPPKAICPHCLSSNTVPMAVSGRGKIVAFTINHQVWLPGMAVPFIFASIELEEQKNLRIASMIVNVEPAQVEIGQSVKVIFEQHEDVWLPLFQPLP